MRNDADLRLAASRNSSIYRRLRLSQARAFAALFVYLGYPRMLHGVLKILRSAPIFRTLTGFSLAYRKTFRSFEEAQRTACRYIEAGHEHEDDVRIHAALSLRIRESDYPVFYHWARMSPSPSRVFDLGGNIGNLFYAYQNYMKFPEGMRWTIYDIPPIRAAGQLIANHRNESRILQPHLFRLLFLTGLGTVPAKSHLPGGLSTEQATDVHRTPDCYPFQGIANHPTTRRRRVHAEFSQEEVRSVDVGQHRVLEL